MADAKVSVGSTGITGHLMGYIYKASNLAVLIDSIDLYPANSGSFVYTNLDADIYQFVVRDSPDGIALGTIIGTPYRIDVTDNNIEIEYIFYRVGGPKPTDPVAGDEDIIDPYLDGKNVQGVFKEGFRFLEETVEYEFQAPNTVHLLVGSAVAAFSGGEVFTVIIANIVPSVVTTAGLFAGSEIITTPTKTLDETFLNKSILCNGTTSRMVITFQPVASIPEGKFFYFSTWGCQQYNTVFLTQGGDIIHGAGTSIILGQNEVLFLERRGARLRILSDCEGVKRVGKRTEETSESFANMLPEIDQILDKADWPRIYKYVDSRLSVNEKIIKTDAELLAYNRALDASTQSKRALFVISPNYLRMPDSQNLSTRAIKQLGAPGTDTTREYDYLGGLQLDGVGPHFHESGTQTEDGVTRFNRGILHRVLAWSVPPVYVNKNASTDLNKATSGASTPTETTVLNMAVIGMRYV